MHATASRGRQSPWAMASVGGAPNNAVSRVAVRVPQCGALYSSVRYRWQRAEPVACPIAAGNGRQRLEGALELVHTAPCCNSERSDVANRCKRRWYSTALSARHPASPKAPLASGGIRASDPAVQSCLLARDDGRCSGPIDAFDHARVLARYARPSGNDRVARPAGPAARRASGRLCCRRPNGHRRADGRVCAGVSPVCLRVSLPSGCTALCGQRHPSHAAASSESYRSGIRVVRRRHPSHAAATSESCGSILRVERPQCHPSHAVASSESCGSVIRDVQRCHLSRAAISWCEASVCCEAAQCREVAVCRGAVACRADGECRRA